MAEQEKIENDSDELYVAVAKASRDEKAQAYSGFFSADELISIGELKDQNVLMPLLSHLTQTGLFRVTRSNGKLGWSVRPREAAKHIKTLDREEMMIYETIEEGYTDGVWTKNIKTRTKIAPNVITKALNRMEKINLIKNVKSIKNPAQKVYMLFHLVASEAVTGNSFYDAGQLDEDFRDQLLNLIVFHVRSLSWAEARRRKVKREPSLPIVIEDDDRETDAPGTKRKRNPADIEDAGEPPRAKQRPGRADHETDTVQLAYRAGTHSYPTAASIHDFLIHSNVIKPAKANSLTVEEIQSCVEILSWDEKLEKVWNTDSGQFGYRTVRGVMHQAPGHMYDDYDAVAGTGFTEAPCGRCPVFDLCHEGGPVNATECTYFDDWLKV